MSCAGVLCFECLLCCYHVRVIVSDSVCPDSQMEPGFLLKVIPFRVCVRVFVLRYALADMYQWDGPNVDSH